MRQRILHVQRLILFILKSIPGGKNRLTVESLCRKTELHPGVLLSEIFLFIYFLFHKAGQKTWM